MAVVLGSDFGDICLRGAENGHVKSRIGDRQVLQADIANHQLPAHQMWPLDHALGSIGEIGRPDVGAR
jgi:hypothetical protein